MLNSFFKILYSRKTGGLTRKALDAFKQFTFKNPFVILQYKDQEFLTYIVDDKRSAVLFDGFAWGYGGEGPNGLLEALKTFGWNFELGDLPPAHQDGVWIVTEGEIQPLTSQKWSCPKGNNVLRIWSDNNSMIAPFQKCTCGEPFDESTWTYLEEIE